MRLYLAGRRASLTTLYLLLHVELDNKCCCSFMYAGPVRQPASQAKLKSRLVAEGAPTCQSKTALPQPQQPGRRRHTTNKHNEKEELGFCLDPCVRAHMAPDQVDHPKEKNLALFIQAQKPLSFILDPKPLQLRFEVVLDLPRLEKEKNSRW